MPIPDASLEGYAGLRGRVEEELGLLRESRSIEYKRSAPWDELKWRTIKACLAMANLRDGGLILVGVAEEGTEWKVTGIASHNNVKLLAISVGPLRSTPVICAKNGPEVLPQKDRLEQGAIYIRPEGLPQSRKVGG